MQGYHNERPGAGVPHRYAIVFSRFQQPSRLGPLKSLTSLPLNSEGDHLPTTLTTCPRRVRSCNNSTILLLS